MTIDLFPAPDRVVLEPDGARAWAYVVRFESGRVWVVPGEDLRLNYRDPLRITFMSPEGRSVGMNGEVTWVGSDGLAIDVMHQIDRGVTRAWSEGRTADLGVRALHAA